MARTTTLLDSRKEVKMTGKVYLRAIVPIGILYSASLVCSNQVYLYLSVAFIQMLKVSLPSFIPVSSLSRATSAPNSPHPHIPSIPPIHPSIHPSITT